MLTARWLDTLSASLARSDPAATADLFAPECYWRDLVAFTWNIKTAEGRMEGIATPVYGMDRVHHPA